MSGNMTAIITMAGLGLRFKTAGYNCPKYKIGARGKTLFEWSMDSLIGYREHISRYVFVARAEDQAKEFIREKCTEMGISNVEILELDHVTDGQATTCMLAISYCEPSMPILVYNIDTYVEPYGMRYEQISGDGHIPCFHGDGDHWSFVRLDQGKVVEVREKERISDNCTLGAYYFSSARLYEDLYREYYQKGMGVQAGEKYIAPLYNLMIQKRLCVTIGMVESNLVHVLGTPEELSIFLKQ